MKIVMIVAAAHAAAILLAAAPQQQLPAVEVAFQIADTRFVNELGAGKARAESAFRPIVVKALEDRIGFLKFETTPAPPTGAHDYRLVISLGDAKSATGEVQFNLGLYATGGRSVGQVSWPFRGLAEATKPLSRMSTIDKKIQDPDLVGGHGEPGELARRFAAGDFSRLVRDVLSRIPMASGGVQITPGADPKWVLPLHRGDMCLDLHSRFRVAHLLQEPGGSEELRLEVEATGPPDEAADALVGPIIARVPDTPDQRQSVSRLGTTGTTVKVTGVFLTVYVRRPVCSEVSLPTDAITGGE
jgi:hypothetical protein